MNTKAVGFPNYAAGVTISVPFTAPSRGLATFCMGGNAVVSVNNNTTGLKIIDEISGTPYTAVSIQLDVSDILNVSDIFNSGIFFPFK
jgi:hypothetical protein